MIDSLRWLNVLQRDLESYTFLYQESQRKSPSFSHLLTAFWLETATLNMIIDRSELLELVADFDLRDYRVRNNLQ